MTVANGSRKAHPLGPMLARVRPVRPWRARLTGLILIVVLGGLLVVAASVTPEASGLGTHRQLGLAPCSLPMLIGIPCPTCGMTTAFAYAVRGRFLKAFHAQPAGLFLAVLLFAIFLVAGWTLVTGRILRINWYRVRTGWVAFAAIGLILCAWGYKVATGWLAGTLPY